MESESVCDCPEIKDQDWHNKEMNWSGKIFYFEDVPHFLNIPLGLEKRQHGMLEAIQRKGYTIANREMILHQPGLFKGRILIEIDDPEQYDANVIQLENTRVLTRVYHGSRAGIKNAVEELKVFAQDRVHVLPGTIYLWYVTCPKCAQSRGGDKTVLLARV